MSGREDVERLRSLNAELLQALEDEHALVMVMDEVDHSLREDCATCALIARVRGGT